MLSLKEARQEDYELMMAWRSDPDIYQGFYQQTKPLEWNEHTNWIHSRNQDWRTFIIWLDGRRIGVVTIGQLDHWSPEIGYYIGEKSLWGQGYGCKAVELGTEAIKRHGRTFCHTTVKTDNKVSLKLLKKLDFECMGEARPGEIWLTKKL